MNNKLRSTWSADFVRNAYLRKSSKPSQDNGYNSYLYPFAEGYYGIHKPIVLLGNHEYDFLGTTDKEYVTIRDGLIPLSYFFLYADCNASKTYLIPERFEYLVPPEWQANVKLYRTSILDSESHKSGIAKAKELYLFGAANSTFVSMNEFEESLDAFVQQLEMFRSPSELKISLFFSNNKSNLWGIWPDEFLLDWSRIIFKKFGFEVSAIKWGPFSQKVDLRGSIYHEINSEYFISDTFTKNFFLSRGSTMLAPENQTERKVIRKIPLSRYHGIEILEPQFVEAYESPLMATDFVLAKDLTLAGLSTSTFEEESLGRWDSWFIDAMASYSKAGLSRKETL